MAQMVASWWRCSGATGGVMVVLWLHCGGVMVALVYALKP